MSVYNQNLIEKMRLCLNRLGRARFGVESGDEEAIKIKEKLVLDKLLKEIEKSVENEIRFRRENILTIQSQLNNCEKLETTGGVIGLMDYKNTGQLLPILKGLEFENYAKHSKKS